MKKICTRCHHEFTEDDVSQSPVDVLEQIFIDATGAQDTGKICPTCREELGILNLLGFGGGHIKFYTKNLTVPELWLSSNVWSCAVSAKQ